MKILRLPEVREMAGFSRSTIYVWMNKKEFPAPISLSARSVGWIEEEIEDWIQKRKEMSRANKRIP